jgi:hypothetical protein
MIPRSKTPGNRTLAHLDNHRTDLLASRERGQAFATNANLSDNAPVTVSNVRVMAVTANGNLVDTPRLTVSRGRVMATLAPNAFFAAFMTLTILQIGQG